MKDTASTLANISSLCLGQIIIPCYEVSLFARLQGDSMNLLLTIKTYSGVNIVGSIVLYLNSLKSGLKEK